MVDVNTIPIVGDTYPLGTKGNAPTILTQGITLFKGSKLTTGPKGATPSQGLVESDARKLYQYITGKAELLNETNDQLRAMTSLLLKTKSFKQNLVAEDKGDDPFYFSMYSRPTPTFALGKRLGVDIDKLEMLKIAGLTPEDINTTMKDMVMYQTLIKAGSSDIDSLTSISEKTKDDYKQLVAGYIEYVKFLNANLGTIAVSLYLYDLRSKELQEASLKDEYLAYPSQIGLMVFRRDKTPDIAITFYPMATFKDKVPGDFGIIGDVFFNYSAGFLGGYKIERDGITY